MSTQITDKYKIIAQIPSGYVLMHKDTQEVAVYKSVSSLLDPESQKKLLLERQTIISKYLLKIIDFSILESVDSQTRLSIIYEGWNMDFEEETFSRMQTQYFWLEEDLIKYLEKSLEALQILHSKNLIHGDIRGNNIAYADDGQIKLIDQFGFGDQFVKSLNQLTFERQSYLAPEIIEESVTAENNFFTTKANDIFALGVVFLEASLLISCKDLYDWDNKIFNYELLQKRLKDVSIKYSSFYSKIISLLCEYNPNHRLDAKSILEFIRSKPQTSGATGKTEISKTESQSKNNNNCEKDNKTSINDNDKIQNTVDFQQHFNTNSNQNTKIIPNQKSPAHDTNNSLFTFEQSSGENQITNMSQSDQQLLQHDLSNMSQNKPNSQEVGLPSQLQTTQNSKLCSQSSQVFQKVKREQMQADPLILIQENSNYSASYSTSHMCSSAKINNPGNANNLNNNCHINYFPSQICTLPSGNINITTGDLPKSIKEERREVTQIKNQQFLQQSIGHSTINTIANDSTQQSIPNCTISGTNNEVNNNDNNNNQNNYNSNTINNNFSTYSQSLQGIMNTHDISNLQNLSHLLDQCLAQTRTLIEENDKGTIQQTGESMKMSSVSVNYKGNNILQTKPEPSQQFHSSAKHLNTTNSIIMNCENKKYGQTQSPYNQQKQATVIQTHFQKQPFLTINQQINSKMVCTNSISVQNIILPKDNSNNKENEPKENIVTKNSEDSKKNATKFSENQMNTLINNMKQKTVLCNLFRCITDLTDHIDEVKNGNGKCCLFKKC